MSATKPRLFRPTLEALENRLCPTSVCEANPVYAAECAQVGALVPQSAITITAVQSGNWSDPATWGGRLPTKGDNVWIPQGIAVSVDGQETAPLRSILDNGVLSFAPNADTSLLVNTLVVGTDTQTPGTPQGELDIGTSTNPIQSGVATQLIFADSSSVVSGETQSQLFPNDTNELSGGLISMGTLNIYGSEVTPYVNLGSSGASAGDTVLNLTSAPVGWQAGDTVLVAGDRPEQSQIASIDGTTVTLTAPLQYTHSVPTGQSVQVADENRSVVIRDEGTATQYMDGADGMVMQMHNDSVTMEYAAFLDPGRTDKSVPLGSTLSNGTVNHVARYSVHFHRDYYPGITNNDPPIQVIGCFQANGVGWGYDNHSSNVDFTDDVAYNDFGAGFATEAGNELGSFQGCLAVDMPGIPGDAEQIEARQKEDDFGWNGDGFWEQSPSVANIDNHVWDAQNGYVLFTQGLFQGPLGQTVTWQHTGTQSAPLAEWSGDTAGGVVNGFQSEWRRGGTITGLTAWDVSHAGIDLELYTLSMSFDSPVLIGLPGAPIGISINTGGYTSDLTIDNADVEGFAVGTITTNVQWETINDGYWNDAVAFKIPPNIRSRTLTFAGDIVFGPSVQTAYLETDNNPAVLLSQQAAAKQQNCSELNLPFVADQILLPNGQELFLPDQAPDYIPFPVGTSYNDPPAFLGLTNAQLWADFGICIDNVMSAGAMASPLTNGLIGAAQTMPPYYWLAGPSGVAPASKPYTLKISEPGGMQTLGQFALQPGWNAIAEIIDNVKHTWLIYGT